MKLSVEGAAFGYRAGERLFQDLCFSVESGELVAVLGPNGAGKTTLLRCVMGFLRWEAGRSCLDGEDIRTIPHRRLWQSLAYVPQARGAALACTVEEMVLLGRGSRRGLLEKPAAEDLEEVRAVLERLGLTAIAKRRCTELSGGQLQMVLIARALAARPRVLILDEPESNLDFRNQLLVLDTLSELAAEGMACLFNTHYPAHALQRAGRSLLLGGGSWRFGDTRRVITEENIRRAFGVRAVIGEIETPHRMVRDVVPLSMEAEPEAEPDREDCRAIAVVAVIAGDNALAGRINRILHEYSPWIVGRMGMPYPDGGVFIINVTLDAAESMVRELAGRLETLPGISVKTTYAQGVKQGGAI